MKLSAKATTAKQPERDALDNPALYRREDTKRIKTKQRDAQRGV